MNEASIQILLVEDNAADAVLLKKELAESPFGPFSVTHVKRLVEALGELHGRRCDAVLLDLGLPDSQGLATLAQIQKQKPREIPIVVLTGLNDEAIGMQALRQGAEDYLVKGGSADSMRARSVRYAIERKRASEIILAAEQSARIREAELAHLSRVTTMGQMASGLAHELNQPLAAILNYASVCLEQIESHKGSSATALTAVHEVMNETRRAGAIISRMRSFVRKQQPHSVPLDINELVRNSVNMLEFEFRHQRMRPHLELVADLPKVLGDAVQIEQVLVNLLFNALEAMGESMSPRNGLTVRTAVHDQCKSVQVCIIDTGSGISPENMGRLFEPFFTTKPKGLGMGLNICRSIIESQGGRLTVTPNPERGMRFCFTVPAVEGVAA